MKRILSLLVAFVMVLGLIPMGVFSAEADPQTVNGSYVDGVWTPGGDGTIAYDVGGTEVALSKTAAPVENSPNTFDITLSVRTSTSTSVQTNAGAVVLVIDISSSMKYCSECGGSTSHDRKCTYYNKKNNRVKDTETRISAAKTAAKAFLESYAGTDAGANRKLAIVTFGTNAATPMGWVNVAGGAGKNDYDRALRIINGITAPTNNGTNLEAGLKAALTLLNPIVNANENVILLTDGKPTYRIDGGNGSDGSVQNCTAAAKQAAAIKDDGASLYTVCYGTADEDAYSRGPTVGEFLRDSIASDSKSYNADNSAQLAGAFAAITQEITSGLSGEGWNVVDPMAAGISAINVPEGFIPDEGNTYHWTLQNAQQEEQGNVTIYTYTMTYRVVLDVQMLGFAEGQYYPTNKPTLLNIDGAVLEFPVPGVRGVLPRTSCTVTKQWNDEDNLDGLRTDSVTVQLQKDGKDLGAPVTLSAGNNWSHTWTDLIEKSGGVMHNYTVVEIQPPQGYTPTVVIDKGQILLTNTHQPEKVTISGTKTWVDGDNQDGIRPDAITVNLLADGKIVDSKTVTARDGWAWSFTNRNKNRDQGTEIIYTVTENTVSGYTAVVTDFNVTNTHTPEVVDIPVSKEWKDANNQDGIRPDSITVHLLANKQDTGKKLTLSGQNGWTATFENMPKFENGTAIDYTLAEETVEGYTTTYEDFRVINTHITEKADVSVSKIWEDANNQDGIRPGFVSVILLANGKPTGKTLQLNANNQWSGSFADLDVYKAGEKITYTVEELTVGGYTSVISGNAADGFTFTNTHIPETLTVSGSKTWQDKDDQDGKRPATITIKLLKNGEQFAIKNITASDGWAWSFENLAKYENGGNLINYTITEEAVDGYTTTYDGYNVINTRAPEQTSVSVVKSWMDNNNQDGIRPESVVVELLADGESTGIKLTLSEQNRWAGVFSGLDRYKAGKVITYTLREKAVDGYTGEITGTQTAGFTVTNTHVPEVRTISGSKTWQDSNNQDGKRPDSITINLLADGVITEEKVVTEQDGWAWTFENLPKFVNGKEITYTITENAVDGYSTSYSDFNVTNTHITEKTEVSVNKIWEDANNQDGIRPSSIRVVLLANGEPTGKSLQLNADNQWSGRFTDLDVYKAGEKITYTVEELTVAGYTGTIAGSAAEGFTFTNTHIPETLTVSGSKTWQDNNNQDGKRPDSITINLLADGIVVETRIVTEGDRWTWSFEDLDKYKEQGTLIVYTITENAVEGYTTVYSGTDVTNTHIPEKTGIFVRKSWTDAENQDGIRPGNITVELLADGNPSGKTLVLNADGQWTGCFTELDVYRNGKKIVYTLQERIVEGYAGTITGNAADGFVITNAHMPETVTVSGSKTWNDNNDQDGIRPDSITIHLLADGKILDTRTVTEQDGWAWSFEDLDKYKEQGTLIVYTITENAVEGYTAAYNGFDVTNTHITEVVSVSGSKIWRDNDNQDGSRPGAITINLLKNGEVFISKEVTEQDQWAWNFENLDKYENGGKEIAYGIMEIAVDGYTTEYEGFNVINTHAPEKVSVSVTKSWQDGNNQDGIRPAAITVKLLADGVETGSALTLGPGNNWTASFTELDRYLSGLEIAYTVEEVTVAGYTTAITGDMTNGYTITNSHTPEIIAVSGSKTWVDDNDRDGKRPESIIINLLADGKTVSIRTVTEQDGWAWSFENLPRCADGREIVYTIVEDNVDGYTAVYDGFNVTNTHTPEERDIRVIKAWADKHDAQGSRPDAINIHLYANGTRVQSLTIREADNWTGVFVNLPKYADGKEIVYSIAEVEVEDYSTVIRGNADQGFTVTNSYVLIPQTGDTRIPGLWPAVMVISLAGVGLALIPISKKRRAG